MDSNKSKNYAISVFYRSVIKYVFRKILRASWIEKKLPYNAVIQERITEYYQIMREVAIEEYKSEFTDDNTANVDAFLKECFNGAEPQKTPQIPEMEPPYFQEISPERKDLQDYLTKQEWSLPITLDILNHYFRPIRDSKGVLQANGIEGVREYSKTFPYTQSNEALARSMKMVDDVAMWERLCQKEKRSNNPRFDFSARWRAAIE